LTVILGWIERASEAAGDRADVAEPLDRAARHAKAAREVMRRSIGAELPESPAERAGTLAHRTVEDLSVESQRRGVRVEVALDPLWAECAVARPHAVWQVLTNLLLNAISVTPSGGRVRVEVGGAGGSARFTVRDDGPGIPSDRRDSIFDGVSDRPGGVGIGLRHARALAQAHGGRLELVPSEGGACFALVWPVLSAPRPAPATPSRERATTALAGMRVLLLEDDPAVIELLELTLRARGAELTCLETAGELRAALAAERYDAALLDLSPLGRGVDAAIESARKLQPALRIIVISGSVVVPPRGDVVWLSKPFEPGELVAALAPARRG
jgi:CheY-like chemotaxis protein